MSQPRPLKIFILAHHPIQYQAPLFLAMNNDGRVEPSVFFIDKTGLEDIYDPEFGRKIKWDLPLLKGYRYKFLKSKIEIPYNIAGGREKFDAVLLFGWNSSYNLVAYISAFLSRKKILLLAESPLNQELQKNGLRQKAKRMVLKVFFRGISGFLYIGEENRKFYKYLGVPEDKLFFAPYAVDNERFFEEAKKYLPQKQKIRDDLGLAKDSKVILFVGKLIEKKRPFDLLKAYENLESENKNLIYVGDGSLLNSLKQYVSDKKIKNVYFVGFKNQTEIGKYYAAADLFVLPSGIGETWGLVVNEAMCFGLPVVVSNLVGCGPDLVRDSENGKIFTFGDIENLSNCMADLLRVDRRGNISMEIIKKYSYSSDIKGIINAISAE